MKPLFTLLIIVGGFLLIVIWFILAARKTANKIIEEIIEPFTGNIDEEDYYELEDKITYAINDNLFNN